MQEAYKIYNAHIFKIKAFSNMQQFSSTGKLKYQTVEYGNRQRLTKLQ